MNAKKILIAGIVAGIVGFLLGSILWMNPWIADLYAQHSDWAGYKPMDAFGGTMNWLLLMGIGGIVGIVLLAILYSYFEKSLKMEAWKKGAFFGFLFWLAASVPAHFNIWLLYTIADIINITELAIGLVVTVITGAVLAIVYEKVK